MRLVADLLDPFPGRTARALEISVVCMLVVLVSTAYGIPDPATSAYVIFFAAKEDCGGSIIANVALVVVVTLVVAIAFGFALLSLNSPEARILLLCGWSFGMFFLATASKLAPIAGTIGLIVAYAIDLFASQAVPRSGVPPLRGQKSPLLAGFCNSASVSELPN